MTRLDAIEALVGIGLIAAGVALWSVGGALVVAGVALVGVALWPRSQGRR